MQKSLQNFMDLKNSNIFCIFSFSTLLHAITMDLDKYTIIILIIVYPSTKSVSMYRVKIKIYSFKSIQPKLTYTCSFKL